MTQGPGLVAREVRATLGRRHSMRTFRSGIAQREFDAEVYDATKPTTG
jgi:hypothetical protein